MIVAKRGLSKALLFMGCVALFGCGEAEEAPDLAPDTDSGSAAVEEGVQIAESDEDRTRPFLPASMRRDTRAETFPHPTHEEIDCAVCHEAPQGHGSHGDLTCAECHRSSTLVTQEAVSREECLSCHHGPLQEKDCVECHAEAGRRVAAWPMQLGIWGGARSRSLSFEHEVHEARDCSSCHRERPSLIPDVDCGSCHEDHHRPEARCMTCHAQPPETAHDVDAHLGCGGAGCHTDARFDRLVFERATCLVCHQAQEDHEVGQECAECHQVRPPSPNTPANVSYLHNSYLDGHSPGGRQ